MEIACEVLRKEVEAREVDDMHVVFVGRCLPYRRISRSSNGGMDDMMQKGACL